MISFGKSAWFGTWLQGTVPPLPAVSLAPELAVAVPDDGGLDLDPDNAISVAIQVTSAP